MSACPSWDARCRGVTPCTDSAFAEAPYCSKLLATSIWFCLAAMCRGVYPFCGERGSLQCSAPPSRPAGTEGAPLPLQASPVLHSHFQSSGMQSHTQTLSLIATSPEAEAKSHSSTRDRGFKDHPLQVRQVSAVLEFSTH